MGKKLNRTSLGALLKVLGKNSIQTIRCGEEYVIYDRAACGDISGATWWDRCVLFFFYSYEYAQLDENGGINVSMRSLMRTWELFLVYVCMVVIGCLI